MTSVGRVALCLVSTMRQLWNAKLSASIIRAATPTDNKYSRGVVQLRTGSTQFPGAAVLSVEGAWRAGAGMVRYVGPATDLVLQRRPETVLGVGDSSAAVIGSGMRTDNAEAGGIHDLLQIKIPLVVDAGGMSLVKKPSALTAITPHDGEFARLAEQHRLSLSGDRSTDAVALADLLGVVVVLKGASTVIAAPGSPTVYVVEAESAWLASAGTGDVLAGVMGAIIAQRRPTQFDGLAQCAATAAFLHSRAGGIASVAGSGVAHPIVALDVAQAVPYAIGEVLAASAT